MSVVFSIEYQPQCNNHLTTACNSQPLTWEDEKQKIEEFREKYIDSCIIETEIRDKPMLQWLSTLPLHHFGISEATLPVNVNKFQLEEM